MCGGGGIGSAERDEWTGIGRGCWRDWEMSFSSLSCLFLFQSVSHDSPRWRPPWLVEQAGNNGLDWFKGQVSQRGCRLVWGLGGFMGADPGQGSGLEHSTQQNTNSQHRAGTCLCMTVWYTDHAPLYSLTVFQYAQLLCCIVGYALMRGWCCGFEMLPKPLSGVRAVWRSSH